MVDPMREVLRSGIGFLLFVCSSGYCRVPQRDWAVCWSRLTRAVNGNYETETL
jgi:hypothetical protein